MKKGFFLGVGSVLLLFGIIIAILVSLDFKQEKKLLKEVDEIVTLLEEDQVNKERIQTLLNRVITKDDYAFTEEAAKNYLKDYLEVFYVIKDVLLDPDLEYVLTTQNYEKDGPLFKDSKDYLQSRIKTLENNRDLLMEFYREDKIMSYLNTALDEYYQEFYRDKLIGKVEGEKETKKDINSFIEILKNMEQLLDLLSNSPDNWYIEGDTIYINDDDILSRYNELINKINNIDYESEKA